MNRPINFNDPTGHWANETNVPVEEKLKIAKNYEKERLKKKKDQENRDNLKYGPEPKLPMVNPNLVKIEDPMSDWDEIQALRFVIAQKEMERYSELRHRTDQWKQPYLYMVYSAEVVFWRTEVETMNNRDISSWEIRNKNRRDLYQEIYRARLGGDLPPGDADPWDQYDSGTDYTGFPD